MAKYILLVDWTEQGVRGVRESPARLDAARKTAATVGARIEQMFMVMGDHDMVLIVEAPNDAAVATFVLRVAEGGNIRTTTLKAFTEDQYRGLLGAL